MPKAIHSGSTLALNSSNHPSIPPEGLVLVANRPSPVTLSQASYLRTLPHVTVIDDPVPVPSLFTPAPADFQE